MKSVLLTLAGLAVLAALVSARLQSHPFVMIHKLPPQHHTFAPLTQPQVQAAAQMFKLKLASNSANPTYTLTASAPVSAPLGASLSANGGWYNQVAYNEVMMGSPDPYSWAQVFLSNANPASSYVVTYNVTMIGSAETFTLGSGYSDSSGNYHANPIAPNVTLSGTASIPIVLPPGYNTADLDFTAYPPNVIYLESVTIQQY